MSEEQSSTGLLWVKVTAEVTLKHLGLLYWQKTLKHLKFMKGWAV